MIRIFALIFVFLFSASPLLACEISGSSLDNGNLVSYYRLENANASVGTYNLTNNNSVTFTTGRYGNGANFVASSNQELYNASTTWSNSSVWSYCFWIKDLASSYSGNRRWVGNNNGDATIGQISILQSSSNFQLRNFGGQTDTSGISWQDNNFHSICVTSNSSQEKVFYDGNIAITRNEIVTSTTGIYIGGSYNFTSEFSTAIIDDLGIWNTTLTTSDIAYIVTSTCTSPISPTSTYSIPTSSLYFTYFLSSYGGTLVILGASLLFFAFFVMIFRVFLSIRQRL